jgi:hypothetical protein
MNELPELSLNEFIAKQMRLLRDEGIRYGREQEASEQLERDAAICDEQERGFEREGDSAEDQRYYWMAEGAERCAAAIRAKLKEPA